MDYKIVMSKGAEEDIDRFVTYLLFEKKSEQAARNLINDFEATKINLTNVAESWDTTELISCLIDILCFIVLKMIRFMWTIFFMNCKTMKIN